MGAINNSAKQGNDPYAIQPSLAPIRRNLVIVSFVIIFLTCTFAKIDSVNYIFIKLKSDSNAEFITWFTLIILFIYWGIRYKILFGYHEQHIYRNFASQLEARLSEKLAAYKPDAESKEALQEKADSYFKEDVANLIFQHKLDDYNCLVSFKGRQGEFKALSSDKNWKLKFQIFIYRLLTPNYWEYIFPIFIAYIAITSVILLKIIPSLYSYAKQTNFLC